MKKLNILLLSVVVMGSTFVSCTKEDANSTVNKDNAEIPSNIVLTGKWNFVKVSEDNGSPTNYPAGWAVPETQCAGVSDYIEFKSNSNVVYGNSDTNNTADCTLTTVPMSYSTATGQIATVTGSQLVPTLLINNLVGSGKNVTFYLVKNTSTEMDLKTFVQGKGWTYLLTKAE